MLKGGRHAHLCRIFAHTGGALQEEAEEHTRAAELKVQASAVRLLEQGREIQRLQQQVATDKSISAAEQAHAAKVERQQHDLIKEQTATVSFLEGRYPFESIMTIPTISRHHEWLCPAGTHPLCPATLLLSCCSPFPCAVHENAA